MNRQKFIGAAALGITGASLVAMEAEAKKVAPEHGACGLSCKACRIKLNKKCDGCGVGKKADCEVFKCAQERKLEFCAQCKGYPCAKIRASGKYSDAWLMKLSSSPLRS